ncbi:ankyrin repeat protein [Colletotrichum musicola]|uniref:Ankyrin repeat protein n=1 Tax=Colletotrichum musicola TaxID=2175873 RepID=A0A8H6KIE0_9PEZI|nr:ankyrin repeat protein [Colletotrichum musicola]
MPMTDDDEERISPLLSDSALTDIRDSAVQCRKLLHKLSTACSVATDDATTYEAEEMMATFNILAHNMGIFRQGHHSLASRLQNVPDISSLVRQLLDTLQHHLGNYQHRVLLERGTDNNAESAVNALAEGKSDQRRRDHAVSCSSESDDSSDRSSVLPSRLDISKVAEEQETKHSPSVALTSARGTINSLRQLSLTIRLAGAQHRSQRIQRFRAHDTYSQVFDVFRHYALQKANFMFPLAPAFLLDRIAESIASRRIRFRYLERHQMKISTLRQPAPALSPTQQQQENTEKPAAEYVGQSQPRIVLSSPEVTNTDPRRVGGTAQFTAEQPESVSSIHVAHDEFPPAPNLDPGGISFTSLARNHLIRDFEPFFCVRERCSSPFACADTYSGWLAHLKDQHSPRAWRCWHCGPKNTLYFSSSEELDSHLREHHGHEVSDVHRSALVKHGMTRKQVRLQSCPFCGSFPEDIEKRFPDRESSQAQDTLLAHVKAHLISIALVLAPIRAEGTNDDNSGSDANSDVLGYRRDIKSDRGDSDLDSDEYDYKISSQLTSPDLSGPAQGIPGWNVNEARPIAAVDEQWLHVMKRKQEKGPNEPDWLEQPVVKAFSQRLRQNEASTSPPLVTVSQSAHDIEADDGDKVESMSWYQRLLKEAEKPKMQPIQPMNTRKAVLREKYFDVTASPRFDYNTYSRPARVVYNEEPFWGDERHDRKRGDAAQREEDRLDALAERIGRRLNINRPTSRGQRDNFKGGFESDRASTYSHEDESERLRGASEAGMEAKMQEEHQPPNSRPISGQRDNFKDRVESEGTSTYGPQNETERLQRAFATGMEIALRMDRSEPDTSGSQRPALSHPYNSNPFGEGFGQYRPSGRRHYPPPALTEKDLLGQPTRRGNRMGRQGGQEADATSKEPLAFDSYNSNPAASGNPFESQDLHYPPQHLDEGFKQYAPSGRRSHPPPPMTERDLLGRLTQRGNRTGREGHEEDPASKELPAFDSYNGNPAASGNPFTSEQPLSYGLQYLDESFAKSTLSEWESNDHPFLPLTEKDLLGRPARPRTRAARQEVREADAGGEEPSARRQGATRSKANIRVARAPRVEQGSQAYNVSARRSTYQGSSGQEARVPAARPVPSERPWFDDEDDWSDC